MPKTFSIPEEYRSSPILSLKRARNERDPKKQDPSPSVLDFGPVKFKIARHFGFCFGVENALETAYRAVEENPDRRIFLLSEMIHNPTVNADLRARGVNFLTDTKGESRLLLEDLNAEDIVIIPAFGATPQMQQKLSESGIDPYRYDTTCPFVKKVWKRSLDLGQKGFTVIIHGKPSHEETRATFSHSSSAAPTLVIRNMDEAKKVIGFIKGSFSKEEFCDTFKGSMSAGFDPDKHLRKLGVVNQTTMLATETKSIAKAIKKSLTERYGEENIDEHYADTKGTLCYATCENQDATEALIRSGADLALVVGGYKSSNTSHLVKLCEKHVPTYFIGGAAEILSANKIRHFDLKVRDTRVTENWLVRGVEKPAVIAITSGASCPDKTVEGVMERILGFFEGVRDWEEAVGGRS